MVTIIKKHGYFFELTLDNRNNIDYWGTDRSLLCYSLLCFVDSLSFLLRHLTSSFAPLIIPTDARGHLAIKDNYGS